MNQPEVIKRISSPVADIELRDDGLYYLKSTTNHFTVEKMKKQTQMFRDEFKLSRQSPGLFINDAREMTNLKFSKEVRDFLAAPENAEIIKAMAVLIKNPLIKISANLFINFSKPPYPTKLFNNEEKAREWLLSLK